MLSKEDNEILTRVGPGTLMGNLLRRYWIPACLTSEIPEPDGAPARVRLLGEDLVAFRTTSGRPAVRSAGSQTRERNWLCRNGIPLGLVKIRPSSPGAGKAIMC